MKKSKLKLKIINLLKTIYDPELPVNIYDLGLIYKIKILNDDSIYILMTLTSPTCPIGDIIIMDIKNKIIKTLKINNIDINITFIPSWNKNMMSYEAKLKLGLL